MVYWEGNKWKILWRRTCTWGHISVLKEAQTGQTRPEWDHKTRAESGAKSRAMPRQSRAQNSPGWALFYCSGFTGTLTISLGDKHTSLHGSFSVFSCFCWAALHHTCWMWNPLLVSYSFWDADSKNSGCFAPVILSHKIQYILWHFCFCQSFIIINNKIKFVLFISALKRI